MAKTAKKNQVPRRPKFHDEKYLGPEPLNAPTNIELVKALNWFNYFYDSKQAKEFVIEYLKFKKASKDLLTKINKVPPDRLQTTGWLCRMLMNGATLPEGTEQKITYTLDEVIKNVQNTTKSAADQVISVVSLQERVKARAGDIIAEIDEAIDSFVAGGDFDPVDFFRSNEVKPQIARLVADHYKPLYSEIFDAVKGIDKQLVQAYSCFTKPRLKKFLELIRNIIGSAENRIETVKAIRVRKPRAKKEKPISVQVSKVQFKAEDVDLGLTSIKPTDIIGAQQLWAYNTKYKKLTVYNAIGPAGFSIKGTTLQGWDEKISVSKRLRKPSDQIKKLMNGGKVVLRKFMDEIKCKPQAPNGRLNTETILLRISR